MSREHVEDAVAMSDEALAFAKKGQWQDAFNVVQTMVERLGTVSLGVGAIIWAEQCIEHAIDGPITGRIALPNVEFVYLDGDALVPSTDQIPVTDGLAWSIDVIRARAACDLKQICRLVFDAIDSGDVGDYIGQLIEVAALTINGTERGYAKIERTADA